MKCPKCQTDNPDTLKFCGECGTQLLPPEEVSVSRTKTIQKPVSELAIGSTFAGRYIIAEVLGKGGMGVVYKAEDTKLKRTVALKFLPLELTFEAEAKERFVREAQSAAALSHTNICTVYEIDEEEGKSFIVMEYVEGLSLKEKIKSGPIELEEVLNIAVQAAEGLEAAHKKGIVHRDIKSGNIMITNEGQTKIMDFGLAKVVGESLITKEAKTMGTAAYMSPEQARGEPVDHRTDIWSLGVVLYELLSGQLPFKGERETTMIYSIVHEEPIALKEIKPDVPIEMEKVVVRALKKDPDSRYQSASEMLKELVGYKDELQAEEAGLFNLRSFLRLIRKPQIATPSAIFLIALCTIIVWFFNRQAKILWARQEVLPEIEQFAENMSYYVDGSTASEVYELAIQAEQHIPDDPLLKRLLEKISVDVKFTTSPTGVRIYIKPYADVDSDWRYLCITPIDSIRFPLGFSRIKLEKEGFQTVYDIVWNVGEIDAGYTYVYELSSSGTLPSEMELLPENGWDTKGVDLPGLENLEEVQVGGFMMDRYEVTNEAYKRFVDDGGYQKPKYWKHTFVKNGRILSWEEALALFTDKTGRPGPATWEVEDYPDGEDDYPVTGVSWYEASAYADFVGKSLPTIYHWERTAFTHGSSDIIPLSNFTGDGQIPVGSSQSMNRFGIYDLAGNVREWCFNESTRGGRFILGGGWNEPGYVFNYAYAQSAFDRSEINGFRCIKYLELDENQVSLEKKIEMPFRDLLSEEPVSNKTFAFFLSQYAYDKTELNPVLVSFEEGEDWIGQKITFNAAYGSEKMMAYLFLPKKGKTPYQAVIHFPGAAALFLRSNKALLRHGDFLLKSGRAIVYPIFKSTYERGDDFTPAHAYPTETNFYKEHVIMWAKDLSRTIDYLETRDDIDTDKLAYYGFSWGAALGSIMLAVEKRIKAGALSSGGLLFQRSLPEAEPINFLPHIKIPVLMLNGRYDYYFPYETSQVPYYTLLGTPKEHKKHYLFDCGHSLPRAPEIKEILAWFDRYLGLVTTSKE